MSYTQFVILSQQRTGSTLLQMLLASHSSVYSFGELFNPNEEIRMKGIKIARHLVSSDDPIKYLENYVYCEYPEHVKAVGFRLFYDHARDNGWESLWDRLRTNKVKVIHLKRKNLLDRYLSLQLAKRSNRWAAFKSDNRPPTESIVLDPAECLKDLHFRTWLQNEADSFFRDNPITEIFYEDLTTRFHSECNRIQNFLELEPEELTTSMVKQRVKKKAEVIVNYDEFKQKFHFYLSKGWAKKEWLDFFDLE